MSPANEHADIVENPYINRNGEKPLTKIRDLENALTVEVVEIFGIDGFLHEFVEAGYPAKAPSFGKTINIGTLEDLIKGGRLWQGLETIHVRVKITGCTRIFTHQLVRQRIGITFSQQCSGEADWRHHDVLLPRPLWNVGIHPVLQAKIEYAKALDFYKASVQEARYLLPHCLETFIYFDASLATVINLYQKRVCTMTQTWEMVLFANRMKNAVLTQIPSLKDAFVNPCEKGVCWFYKAKDVGGNIFLNAPDFEHDTYEWNPKSFVSSATVEEQSTRNLAVRTSHYMNAGLINKEHYDKMYKEYQAWL